MALQIDQKTSITSTCKLTQIKLKFIVAFFLNANNKKKRHFNIDEPCIWKMCPDYFHENIPLFLQK